MTVLQKPASEKQDPRQGFALLFIFAMAAAAAVMLYMQLPRVAFEAQRDKEQLLIDRGEQYSRAVQLFVRKFNRFPQDISALENTQNIRFLRKQYTDPITGKNEWRLIHVGPGGVFTDSLIYGKKKTGDASAPQNFIAEVQQVGGNPVNTTEGINLATRRRASDQPGAPGDPNNAGSQGAPGGLQGPVMVLPDGRIVPATSTGIPAASGQPTNTPGQPGVSNGFPGGIQPPGGIGVQAGVNQPGQLGSGLAGPNGALPPGFQNQGNQAGINPGVNQAAANQAALIQAGNPSGAPPTSAANLINNLLTSPKPGGLNGTDTSGANAPLAAGTPGSNAQTGSAVQTGAGAQTIGGGFAGVASKREQDGIKNYRDHTAYNEWEFVYDMSKDTTRNGGAAVPAGGSAAPAAPGAGATSGSTGTSSQLPSSITAK